MNRKNGLHVIMTLLFILCQLPLFSAVLTVTTTEDEVAGSLRETIAVAAENGERNVIYLPAGHYVLNPWTSGGEPSTIYIDIPKTDNINLYIIGEDADSTIIDVDNRDRAFEILSGKVYISDITIQNSTPDDGVTDRTQNGGAIHNKGELALVRCKLINNSSGSDQITYAQGFRGGKGGAIYNDVDAEMVIDRCVISGNYTRGGRTGDFDQNPGGDGGGIYNRGDMEIANSLITNNSTGEGGDGGSGGGIFHSTGYLKISASSIANNSTGPGQRSFGPLPPLRITSGGDGGGLYIESGKVDMVNCTVSGNGTGRGMMEAYTTLLGGAGYGGGIAVNDGELSLNLCTVLDNSTGAGALNENSSKTATGDGGGIYVYYGAEANIENSIVALNTVGTLGVGTNGKGAINSEGYNLFGDTADLSLLGDLTGNLTGVDPLVEPLAYNSAFTLTHALKAGSPAIDAGNAEHIYDQRNFRRDTDSTITPSGSDIGAYEFNASAEGFLHIDKKILTFSADTAGNISGDKTVTISRDSIWVIYTAPYHSLVSFDKVSGEGAEQVTISPQPLQDNPREPGTYVAHFPVRTTSGMIYENNIIVIVDVIDSEATSAPFGSFDTPASGSTVSSSIPVTGWALDDIGIESIKIYRDPAAGEGSDRVYLGDAMQVENARPDLASSYPSYPGSTKAGWGYMMLTNFLPNSGNGTFSLYAVVTDVEGKQLTMGPKVITCDNANAVNPFGAIDTPGQGETVSGDEYFNFGWALTPLPNAIPTDASTIEVFIDGESVGNPAYNVYREDIATLFPGYNNSGGALGHFAIDTTAYANGVHTISWGVTDDAGNEAGIGSRYFSIQNETDTSQEKTAAVPPKEALRNTAPDRSLLDIKTAEGEFEIASDEKGVFHVKIKATQRLVMRLKGHDAGYLDIKGKRAKLPVGSRLDTEKGIFYWQPGPGFLGSYTLVFTGPKKQMETSGATGLRAAEKAGLRKTVEITIVPRHN